MPRDLVAEGLQAGAAGLGLVPTINKWNTSSELGEILTIDKLEARCARLRKNLGFSAKSLSRGAGQAWMLTLTYRGVDDWNARHVSEALRLLRQWLHRAYGWRLRYLWVMELQKRGAPHYHVVIWVPRDIDPKDLHLDARGWWPHGMTNAVMAVAPVRYVMKYASKFDSVGAFPKGARCYGIGGLDCEWRRMRRWINWPTFIKHRASVNCLWRRAKGGGWLEVATGEVWPSEYGLSVVTPNSTAIVRLHDHGRPMGQTPGPFSWLPERGGVL